MNRATAKEVAKTITNEQLKQMFDNAKKQIGDWTKVSNVNKTFTKGAAWNVLAKGFDITYNYHWMAKVNMIHEFGEYLPEDLKPIRKVKDIMPDPVHQEPIF